MERTTYILGHRNPDADAVCSAAAYAALKHARGETHCRAARCGNSNARIDAIFQRFGVDLPPFVGDLTPRVRDIMKPRERVHLAHPWHTCAEALKVIDEHDVRLLPIVDAEERAVGALSIFQLGEYFLPKPREPREMRRVHTTIGDIIRALGAEVLNLVNPDQLEDLYVRVGAMDIRSFGRFAHDDPTLAEQSIIVVGDRYDIQTKSIQVGVRLLVITGNLELDEEVIAFAKERGVSLVISPWDSATTSWVIRSATRVERLISNDPVCFAPDTKLGIVRRKLANLYAPAFLVVDEEKRLLGVFSKGDLIRPTPTELILVDHNELSQAVPGADQVNIVEIVDHHRLGNIPTEQPILFINEPVGSTCTIIADLYRREGRSPSPEIAGILMGGILSDTLNLQSPTSTTRDASILEWLESLAGTSREELTDIIFRSGSVILSTPPDEVINADCKTYIEGELQFSVSQVEELGFNNFRERLDDLAQALEETLADQSKLFATLLVTDINTQNSLLLVRGNEEVVSQISFSPLDYPGLFDLPGIVSRKKQLIPYLTGLLRSLGLTTSSD